MKTLIGDALLTAACICYLGPIEQQRREQLVNKWKTVCQGKTKDDDEIIDDTCGITNQSYGQTRCSLRAHLFLLELVVFLAEVTLV